MAKKTKVGVIKKTPTQKSVKKVKEVKEPKTVKPVKKVTSAAVTRLKARMAKWDGTAPQKPVKVSTSDFLDFLANSLERDAGVSYASEYGILAVKLRRPEELQTTIKYLRRRAVND